MDAPGRDPIVSRVIWLRGMEAQNQKARDRCIYIHGTPEERRIGKPASFGCIRMRSHDIIDLYGRVHIGTHVLITLARFTISLKRKNRTYSRKQIKDTNQRRIARGSLQRTVTSVGRETHFAIVRVLKIVRQLVSRLIKLHVIRAGHDHHGDATVLLLDRAAELRAFRP